MKGLQFDIEERSDGVRIYARLEREVVGALEAGSVARGGVGRMPVTIVYVLPRWRGRGIATALREYLHAMNQA